MGLNKPITVGGGLTAAEVQSIIDAQTTAIAGKVDAQTNTLKTDIPSSISGGASISDINAALDEKLPQYQNRAVVKSKQFGTFNGKKTQQTIAIPKVNSSKCHIEFYDALEFYGNPSVFTVNTILDELSDEYFKIRGGFFNKGSADFSAEISYEIIEFY